MSTQNGEQPPEAPNSAIDQSKKDPSTRYSMAPSQGRNKGAKKDQKEVDANCYRLSRPAKKFDLKNSGSGAPAESYAAKYFKEHPIDEENDIKPPGEKLEEASKLEDEHERLVKVRILTALQFGDISSEVLDATVNLADHYNDQEKHDAALRHYNKCQDIIRQREDDGEEVSKDILFRCNLGLAEQYYDKRKEHENNIKRSLKLFSRLDGEECSDDHMIFRRNLLSGRIKNYFGNTAKAIIAYNKLIDKIPDYVPEHDKQLVIYREIAHCYILREKFKEAEDVLQLGVKAYEDAGEHEKAAKVQKEIDAIEEQRKAAEYTTTYEEEDTDEPKASPTHHHHHKKNASAQKHADDGGLGIKNHY